MDTPQILTRVYDLLLYLIPQVSKFPRAQRYHLLPYQYIDTFLISET